MPPNQWDNRQEKAVNAMSINASLRIDFTQTPTPLATILGELSPHGTSVTMADLVGRHITVWQINPFATDRYGPAARIVATTDDGELLNAIVGQSIIVPKFLMASDRLPFDCTIILRQGGVNATYFDVE